MERKGKQFDEKTVTAVVRLAFSIIGYVLMIYSVIFLFITTEHFGSNWWPKTTIELLTDISGLIIFLTGLFLSKIKNNKE